MNRLFAIVILIGVAIIFTIAGITLLLTIYNSMVWKPEILRIYRSRDI